MNHLTDVKRNFPIFIKKTVRLKNREPSRSVKKLLGFHYNRIESNLQPRTGQKRLTFLAAFNEENEKKDFNNKTFFHRLHIKFSAFKCNPMGNDHLTEIQLIEIVIFQLIKSFN